LAIDFWPFGLLDHKDFYIIPGHAH